MAKENIFPLTGDATDKLVKKSYMHHAAFPNWKDSDRPDLTRYRFFLPETTVCVNGGEKYMQRFFSFLEKNGLNPTFFKNSLFAVKNDIQAKDGNTTALNRGIIDFRYYTQQEIQEGGMELIPLADCIDPTSGYALALGYDPQKK